MATPLAAQYHLLPNNAYVAQEQSFAETEVGDVLQPDFHPQVKIKRWDNEVNLSVRLVHEETVAQVREEDGRIKWAGGKVEAHFYDTGSLGEGGGFELEVICFEKPKDGRVQMTLQTKGLEFFYQPELTPEEIAKGCIRPENVVGSYAVYHATQAGDYSRMGGKNYQAGKFCHIYRPRLEDATGNWTWGELNIDLKTGLLTVGAPREFWDSAVYPVRHAAGLEFGYHTIGATDFLNCHSGVWRVCKATSAPASDGNLESLACYARKTGGDAQFAPALYSDSAGSPHSRLAYTNNGTLAGADFAWVETNLSYPGLVSATQYWLGVHSPVDSLYVKFDSVGTNEQYWMDSGWAAIFSGNGQAFRLSIYAIYSAGGGNSQTISAAGNIAAAEAFGAAAVLPSGVTLSNVGAIVSGLLCGNPMVAPGPVAVSNAGGIAGTEAVGDPGIIPGAVNLSSAGNIPGAEVWGLPVLTLGAKGIIGTGNISGQETFGSLAITTGPVAIAGAGSIPSGEALGLPLVGEMHFGEIPEKVALSLESRCLRAAPAMRRLAVDPQITRLQVTPDV